MENQYFALKKTAIYLQLTAVEILQLINLRPVTAVEVISHHLI